jgi:hypothetical protein
MRDVAKSRSLRWLGRRNVQRLWCRPRVQRDIVRLHAGLVYDRLLQLEHLRSLCQPERHAMRRWRRVRFVFSDDAAMRQVERSVHLQCCILPFGLLQHREAVRALCGPERSRLRHGRPSVRWVYVGQVLQFERWMRRQELVPHADDSRGHSECRLPVSRFRYGNAAEQRVGADGAGGRHSRVGHGSSAERAECSARTERSDRRRRPTPSADWTTSVGRIGKSCVGCFNHDGHLPSSIARLPDKQIRLPLPEDRRLEGLPYLL